MKCLLTYRDLIEHLKKNFADGYIVGAVKTVKDLIHWIHNRTIWRMILPQRLQQLILPQPNSEIYKVE